MKTVETMRVLKKKRRKYPPRFQEHMAIRYDKRSSTLGSDYISLANITGKRLKIPIRAHEYYDRYLGWDPRSIDLVFRNNRYFIHVVVERADPRFMSNGNIIGIDRGIVNLAVGSDNSFHNGFRVKMVRNIYSHTRKTLQKKGTRSAKRRLKSIARRETRFQRDVNHCISKKIVGNMEKGSIIVLEDLKGIRKAGKNRSKNLRRDLNSWAFYQLDLFLNYKARENGMGVEHVDPAYTSQKCSRCSYTSKKNRRRSEFLCLSCGFALNADLNAARNIRNDYINTLGPYQLTYLVTNQVLGAYISIPDVTSF
jgi:IS605 OrfB family transposase